MAQEELDRTEWVQKRFELSDKLDEPGLERKHDDTLDISASDINSNSRLSRIEMTVTHDTVFKGELDTGSIFEFGSFASYIVEDTLVVGSFEDPLVEFGEDSGVEISFETINDIESDETSRVTVAAVVHEHRG